MQAQEKTMLYTTVTVSDFNDVEYINQLIELNIGIELALLTKLSNQYDQKNCQKDLDALKQEMTDFMSCFKKFNIPFTEIRIHQPGGYTYSWFDENGTSGFDALHEFFSWCSAHQGFKNYVIHAPYGNQENDDHVELDDFREKLKNLVPQAKLEVEEIATSNDDLKKTETSRCYQGLLFEELMRGQRATVLLDTYECGGVNQTLERMNNLIAQGFKIKSIHMHKDKHKFLTQEEVGLLSQSGFSGNLINEGFVKDESSFDEFLTTKSMSCIVTNEQRIEMLKTYKKK